MYTNGFVTLGGFYDFPTYKPKDLKETKVPMAAPYFADADSRGYKSGMVYYRWTDDTALLNRAKQDIGVSDFSPDSLLIATWDKIGFYNHHDNMASPR